MILALGDQCGFVIVDQRGGLHAFGKKTLGVKAKAVRDRLSKPDDDRPDLREARSEHAAAMQRSLQILGKEQNANREWYGAEGNSP